MWMMVIPLMLLVTMTPFVMVKEDLAQQRQTQSAQFYAKALLLQQQALLKYCAIAAPGVKNCGLTTPTDIAYSRVKPYVAPALSASWLFTSRVMKSVSDGTRVLSYLDLEALSAQPEFKRDFPLGLISAEWVKLCADIEAAGILNTSTGRPQIQGAAQLRSVNTVSFTDLKEGYPVIATPY